MNNKIISDLEKYFKTNTDRLTYKCNHYFDISDRHFKRYRDKEVIKIYDETKSEWASI